MQAGFWHEFFLKNDIASRQMDMVIFSTIKTEGLLGLRHDEANQAKPSRQSIIRGAR
jgi:hypothetical protein